MKDFVYNVPEYLLNETALKAINSQIQRAHRYYNILVDIENKRRNDSPPAASEEVKKAAKAFAFERIREERKRCGQNFGTYLLIEDAINQAKTATPYYKPIKERYWDETGSIGVQLQKEGPPINENRKKEDNGLSIEKVLSCQDSRLKLLHSFPDAENALVKELPTQPNKARIWIAELRTGSKTKQISPVSILIPFIYHREIPSGSIIKWVKLQKKRVATHFKYELHFIVETPSSLEEVSPKFDMVAIDIGWRKVDNGYRIATLGDSENKFTEICLSQKLIDRIQKVEDLQSIIDKNFEAIKKTFLSEKEKQYFPEWLLKKTEYLSQWRSFKRFSNIIEQWRNRRFENDTIIYETLENWRKQNKHLYEWKVNQERNVLNAKKQFYRKIALEISQNYKEIILEGEKLTKEKDNHGVLMNLSRFASDLKVANDQRFTANLSAFREFLIEKNIKKIFIVPSPYTSKTCNKCGSREEIGGAKMHTCKQCGATWDRDENATKNLLRAARCREGAPLRSQTQHEAKTGETRAHANRRKALESRRARALAKADVKA